MMPVVVILVTLTDHRPIKTHAQVTKTAAAPYIIIWIDRGNFQLRNAMKTLYSITLLTSTSFSVNVAGSRPIISANLSFPR